MNRMRSTRYFAFLSALVSTVLALAACTPEQTPASAARTAAAVRTPASASTTTQAGAPPTLTVARGSTPAAAAQSKPTVEATPTPSPAILTASPNPVPVSAGQLATTTISWNTGRPQDGQVYVSENGQTEKLFASGPQGSQDAPWIRDASTYDFRLYAGTEHAERLASLTVGGPERKASPSVEQQARLSAEPKASVSAHSNPAPADDNELGSTTISWTSDGPTDGEIYVSQKGGPERLFARGKSGAEVAGWICRGQTYDFHLYGGPGQTDQLSSVTVTRADDAPDHEPPPPELCPARDDDQSS